MIVKNFWDFYLVKFGIKNKTKICLNTHPDNFIFELDRNTLINNRSLFKSIFRCIKDSRLEYSKKTNNFTIYDTNKANKKEFAADVFSIETAEKSINVSKNIEEYDKDFFLIETGQVKFLIRKKVPSDIYMIQENFLAEQYSFIYPYLKDANVIDIGANIGDTAILFCQKGAKAVYAYEPHPFFFDTANKNIQLNNLNNKIVMKSYGVGASELIIKVKDDTMFGPTGVFGSKKASGNEGIDIKVVPFSKIIEDVKNIDVLKMDCEGAEFEAILSCPPELLRKIKVMAIEFHDNPTPIVDYLEKSGFNVKIQAQAITKYGHTGLLFAMQAN
ncbi:MAG: FkbM family methyltransferase [Candidatus Omnitrophota bacterium]